MKLPDGLKMTPMLKQYTEWKGKYPDCLLLFRMGDFFELFFDDAVTASEVLDITLTARDQDKQIPMAGVPHHALDAYMGRLIAAGHRVALCDQMTEPDGKGIVERQVVRVVTPSTYVPQDSEADGRLAALSFDTENVSIALLNVGTGRLEAGTFRRGEALSLVSHFSPGELIAPRGQEQEIARYIRDFAPFGGTPPMTEYRERSEFSPSFGSSWLCRRWNIASLRAMGLEESDPAVGAAAAALRYLEETQFGGGEHVHFIHPLKQEGMLIIDSVTQANLELTEGDGISLYSVLNRCRTPMGRRLLRDWITHPLTDLDEINFRQDCIETMTKSAPILRRLSSALGFCRDVERALGRLSLKVGNPRDLGAVRDTLSALPELYSALKDDADGVLSLIFESVPELSDIASLLDESLADELPRMVSAGGIIKDGFDAELDDSRDAILHAEEHLKAFEQAERERTGIKLKVGINKVFGYYIEVSKSYLDRVPEDYIRRQTVVSGERYINEALKDIERRVFRAEQEIGEREGALYRDVLEQVMSRSADLQALSASIARIDVLRSLAEVARDSSYVRPEMDRSRVFDVKGARHPVVEKSLGSLPFTPNDIVLDPDGSCGCIAIITGPNMAGKSTYLRTAALVALLAHIGSFVPAECARIGLLDRIFTRIGARDELSRGRSTFMVEMVETAGILRNTTSRSLVILDEVGRGTSTYDGMSIAWAVVEFLHLNIEGRTKALFATHYHELTSLSLPALINLSMAVEESSDGIRFLHKVVGRPADRSYGIEVARLAGVPHSVLSRARELLAEFEQELAERNAGTLSKKNVVQREIFFDSVREGVIEQLAYSDPNKMTPIEALQLVSKLRDKSRRILDLK